MCHSIIYEYCINHYKIISLTKKILSQHMSIVYIISCLYWNLFSKLYYYIMIYIILICYEVTHTTILPKRDIWRALQGPKRYVGPKMFQKLLCYQNQIQTKIRYCTARKSRKKFRADCIDSTHGYYGTPYAYIKVPPLFIYLFIYFILFFFFG